MSRLAKMNVPVYPTQSMGNKGWMYTSIEIEVITNSTNHNAFAVGSQ